MKPVELVLSQCVADDRGEAHETLLISLTLTTEQGNIASWPPGDSAGHPTPDYRAEIGIADAIDSYLRQLTRQIYKPKPLFGGIGRAGSRPRKPSPLRPG